jgi:hypothetical protein
MPNPVQLLVFGLIRKVVRAVWSLVLLAIALGAGYYIGQRWGIAQGDPNGMWYGLIGGFVVWAVILRPKRRRRRRFDHTTYDDGDGDGWFGDSGDGEGGSDD